MARLAQSTLAGSPRVSASRSEPDLGLGEGGLPLPSGEEWQTISQPMVGWPRWVGAEPQLQALVTGP